MRAPEKQAKLTSVSIARAEVTRANGDREIYYSLEKVPFWHVRRRYKLQKHLRFMRNEDRSNA